MDGSHRIMEQAFLALEARLRFLGNCGIRWLRKAEVLEKKGLEKLPKRDRAEASSKIVGTKGQANALDQLREELGECTRCRLSQTRKTIVFGEGNPNPQLVLVGEGPGFEEDQQGRPFVGPAGQLLDRILNAMGISRSEVYIGNVVKCRPPSNRTPKEDEMDICGQFLNRQLELLQPSHVLALGATAANFLLGSAMPLGRRRGRFEEHASGARIMPTYHPAYLLRNPEAKKLVWQDVQQIMQELDLGKRSQNHE